MTLHIRGPDRTTVWLLTANAGAVIILIAIIVGSNPANLAFWLGLAIVITGVGMALSPAEPWHASGPLLIGLGMVMSSLGFQISHAAKDVGLLCLTIGFLISFWHSAGRDKLAAWLKSR